MKLRFGFELEGFFIKDGVLELPPSNYPTDGFPGLCEVRTFGGQKLEDAYFYLLNKFRQHPFDIDTCVAQFSGEQKRKIRSRTNVKDSVDIQNIYGKEPRELGNKTLASFQISISNETVPEGYSGTSGNLTKRYAEYGLFDYLPIIRALDQEFAAEIKDSKRQPGFYALKGNRIEYRSLPNTVFEIDLDGISTLLKRIKKCVY